MNNIFAHYRDSLVWLPAKDGSYSVKSGHGKLMLPTMPESSSSFNRQWNVWRVKAPPKMKTFLWKAMAGVILVSERLVKRGVTMDAGCKRCGREENVDHVLLHCDFAQKIWDLAPIQIRVFHHLPSLPLFLSEGPKFINLPHKGLHVENLYVWICWNLWTARNQLLFMNKTFSEEKTVSKEVSVARAWQEAQASCPQPRRAPVQSRQRSPVYHSGILCFVDAAWDPTSQSCGMEWTFRTHTYIGLGDASNVRREVTSALTAEALALSLAISQAKERGLEELHIHYDSQLLMTFSTTETSTMSSSASYLILD